MVGRVTGDATDPEGVTDPVDLDPVDLDAVELDPVDLDPVDLDAVGDAGDDATPFLADLPESDDERVASARRRHGAAGGALAAGMLGLAEFLGGKPKQEAPIVVASNSDPVDIDTDGIVIDIDSSTSVVAPPLPRRGDPPPEPAAPPDAPRRRTKRVRQG
jgi:hypothetical protein